jgi:hypothetical protein
MILAAIVADDALAGATVLYLDFERTAELLLERLQAAGLGDEELGRVHYLRPRRPADRAEIAAMVERLEPSLVAIDSYDAALALYGLEAKNEDVRTFDASVIEPLRLSGASPVIADHVTKDRERRGRYSIGGQAKLALADAHLGLSAITPLRRGAEGKSGGGATLGAVARLAKVARLPNVRHDDFESDLGDLLIAKVRLPLRAAWWTVRQARSCPTRKQGSTPCLGVKRRRSTGRMRTRS